MVTGTPSSLGVKELIDVVSEDRGPLTGPSACSLVDLAGAQATLGAD